MRKVVTVLAVTAGLYYSLIIINAQSSLQPGVSSNYYTNATVTTGNSTTFALPANATQCTWQSTYATTPSAISLLIQTSNDNSSWNTVVTSTNTAGDSSTFNTSAKFTRARIGSSTGGSTLTVSVMCKIGFVPAGNVNLTSLTTANLTATGTVILDGLTYPSADGTNGQCLSTNGSGTLSFSSCGGGGGTPAGPANSIQFNDSGSFGGSDLLTWDGSVFQVGIGVPPNNYQIAAFINSTNDSASITSAGTSDGYAYGDLAMGFVAQSGDVIPSSNSPATPGTIYQIAEWWGEMNDTTDYLSRDVGLWVNGIGQQFIVNGVGDIGMGNVSPVQNVSPPNLTNANLFIDGATGNISIKGLKTTGSAGSKKVVCVDTATGQLYASSTGTDCSN